MKVGQKKVFATCIVNKTGATILPIICEHAISFSSVHTDDTRVCISSTRLGYMHDSVVHNFNFVVTITGVNS